MTPWLQIPLLFTIGCGLSTTSAKPEIDVRLVDGINKYEGRVEVYWNGTWGTVCDDQWDRRDAWVICRQLGMGNPLQITKQAHFGAGPGPILLDNLECTGYERTIFNCSHSGVGSHDCTHTEDAGVACSPPLLCDYQPCHHGTCVNSGENFYCICHPGYTGQVCDEDVTCVLPAVPPPSAHFISPQPTYTYQDVVMLACDEGPSSTSWSCNEYGQWNYHDLPCTALSGAYLAGERHSYTVIGIGSALVVIGIAVLISVIFLLYRHKRRLRVTDSMYDISNLSRPEGNATPSAYLTMTGGTSPMPSPRRSSTEPLIKTSRANMALPPTPPDAAGRNSTTTSTTTELVKSPHAAISLTQSIDEVSESNVERKMSAPSPLALPLPPAPPTHQQQQLQPVAPSRAKKQINQQRNPVPAAPTRHFTFPAPPPMPKSPSRPIPNQPVAGAVRKTSNAGQVNNGKTQLLSPQKSTDSNSALVMYNDGDAIISRGVHYNDEHNNPNDVNNAERRTSGTQSPYSNI